MVEWPPHNRVPPTARTLSVAALTHNSRSGRAPLQHPRPMGRCIRPRPSRRSRVRSRDADPFFPTTTMPETHVPGRVRLRSRRSGIVNPCRPHRDFQHSPRDAPVIAASCLATSDIDHPAHGHRADATLGKALPWQIDGARGPPTMPSLVPASTGDSPVGGLPPGDRGALRSEPASRLRLSLFPPGIRVVSPRHARYIPQIPDSTDTCVFPFQHRRHRYTTSHGGIFQTRAPGPICG